MSEWVEVNLKEFEVDHPRKEVSVLVSANDNGNIYAILSFDTIKKLSGLIEKI